MTTCCCCCLFPSGTCNGTCSNGGAYTYTRDATILCLPIILGLRLLCCRTNRLAGLLDFITLLALSTGGSAMFYGQYSGTCTCTGTDGCTLCGKNAAYVIGITMLPIWFLLLVQLARFIYTPFRRAKLAFKFGLPALYMPFPLASGEGRTLVSVHLNGSYFTLIRSGDKYFGTDGTSHIRKPHAIHGVTASRTVTLFKGCEGVDGATTWRCDAELKTAKCIV